MEEPEAGQGALPRPEVLGTVIHLHLHTVVSIHALPVAASDKKPVAQRYHPTILMERVQELHLCKGQGKMCGDPLGTSRSHHRRHRSTWRVPPPCPLCEVWGVSLGLCLVSSSIPMYDRKVGGAARSMGSEEQMGQAEFCQTAQAGAPHTLREGSAGKGGILWGSAV